MNRRTFLGTTAAALMTNPLRAVAADSRIQKAGLQLYTVRDDMAKDFEGPLARVAAIGYKEVEFAGYFDRSPKDVRAILDRSRIPARESRASLLPARDEHNVRCHLATYHRELTLIR